MDKQIKRGMRYTFLAHVFFGMSLSLCAVLAADRNVVKVVASETLKVSGPHAWLCCFSHSRKASFMRVCQPFPECGAKLKVSLHCTECGAKLQPNAKFCGECGHKTEQLLK